MIEIVHGRAEMSVLETNKNTLLNKQIIQRPQTYHPPSNTTALSQSSPGHMQPLIYRQMLHDMAARTHYNMDILKKS